MKRTVVEKAVTPVCYIEGIRYNCLSAKIQTDRTGAKFGVYLPYDPNAFPRPIRVTDAEGGQTHENGLEILYTVEIHGIVENTVVHLFEKDLQTGDENLLIEGRVTSIMKSESDSGQFIVLMGKGPSLFMEELTVQMADQGRALQIKDTWNAFGVDTVSSISSAIQSDGIRKGILKLLDKAGTNTDVFHNLTWRMFRLFHRMQFIDNPKALGFCNVTRMNTILDKALSKTKSSAPISLAISKVLEIIQYYSIGVIRPSFMNATEDEVGNLKVDTESEIVDHGVSPTAGPSEHLSTNEIVFMPTPFFSPPARCNVIFPSQYKKLNVKLTPQQNSTRGIVNITGRAQLTGAAESNALIMPAEVSEGITSGGKYYISPSERITGIRWSPFGQGRPEAVEELSDDYIKGYMENIFARTRFAGYQITLTGAKYNPKPIVGLPTLILSSDGRHWISQLEAFEISFMKNRASNNYTFGLSRPYDEEVPTEPDLFWYEHDMYSQDNIGAYIYPRIIGKYNEVGSGGIVPEEQSVDMSIMAHLFQVDTELSTEEQEAEAEKPGAPKKAIDNLFKLWKESEVKWWFDRYYGSRKPITKDQWFTNFLKCQHSEDWFIVGNGYTLATNSVTVPSTDTFESADMTAGEARNMGIAVPDSFPDDAPFGVGALTSAPETAFEEKIPDDQEVTGCFVKERQNAILPLAINAISIVSIPAHVEQHKADLVNAEVAPEDIPSAEDIEDE